MLLYMIVYNMSHPLSVDDHSRVVLTQTDLKSGRDYINASFVDVSNISLHCAFNYKITFNY